MDLNEWLARKGLSVYEFSRESHLSLPTIYKALSGKNISRRSAFRIVVATKGAVEADKLFRKSKS